MTASRKRLGLLISGRGSNMAAILAATADRDYPAEIAIVISDKIKARGLDTALKAGISSIALARERFATRQAHEAAIIVELSAHGVDLVCLAGYMRILSREFTKRFEGRLVNIHPGLLPAYKGLDTHARVLADGARQHGCSVHFVNGEVDGGAVIAQAIIPVLASDDEARLAARVLQAEHKLYPEIIRNVAEGRIELVDGRVIFT